MSKTIEDAAREAVRKEFRCEKCAWKDDCDLCGGENTAFDCCECPADSYEDGFKAGAAHLMSMPLAWRLTTEEKENIKNQYIAELEAARHYMRQANSSMNRTSKMWHNQNRAICIGRLRLLETIFGADFFKEEE